jgi:hypothetical protein
MFDRETKENITYEVDVNVPADSVNNHNGVVT